MKDKRKAPVPVEKQDMEALYEHLNPVASSTECTGLMPTPATEPSELDSYSDIYDIPLTESPKKQFENQTHYPERP